MWLILTCVCVCVCVEINSLCIQNLVSVGEQYSWEFYVLPSACIHLIFYDYLTSTKDV